VLKPSITFFSAFRFIVLVFFLANNVHSVFAQAPFLSFYRAENKDSTELWSFYLKNMAQCKMLVQTKQNTVDTFDIQSYLQFKQYFFYHYTSPKNPSQNIKKVSILFEGKIHFTQDFENRNNADTLKFVLGSCNLTRSDLGKTPPYFTKYIPGEKITGSTAIFNAMNAEKPQFMLWLGDNVYYIGKQNHGTFRKMMFRQLKHRKNKDIRNFINNNIHHTTWDDHDYGPNNSGKKFKRKWEARRVFNTFWSDTTDLVFNNNRITKYFEKDNAAFFVLDVRWDRKEGETMLGKEQMEWLKNALKNCNKPVKFIVSGSQVLNNSTLTDTWSSFGDEREALFRFIDSTRIKGIVFISGDRHLSCMFSKTLPNGTTLYDYTSSALTSFAFPLKLSQKHDFVQPGFDYSSYTNKHNYGAIEVFRAEEKYIVRIKTKDKKGKTIWEKTIEM